MTDWQERLDALCAKGPWMSTVDDGARPSAAELSKDDLRAYYRAIRLNRPPEAVSPAFTLRAHPGSRLVDRANTLLKRAGLIRYDREQRQWVAFCLKPLSDDPVTLLCLRIPGHEGTCAPALAVFAAHARPQ